MQDFLDRFVSEAIDNVCNDLSINMGNNRSGDNMGGRENDKQLNNLSSTKQIKTPSTKSIYHNECSINGGNNRGTTAGVAGR